MSDTIHVRTAASSRPRFGRYAALKPLGDAVTICGGEATTYDIVPRDLKATLDNPIWRDRVCKQCVQGAKS